MSGRKIKLLDNNKKNLTKEEIELRKEAENLASDGFKELQNTAPRGLNSAIARAEYERIISDLKKLPIRNLDRVVIELYCTWYAIYREAQKDVEENGIFAKVEDSETGEFVILRDKKNPSLTVMKEASAEIKSCASNLGLTVDSRMRMFMPKKEDGKKEQSVFEKFGG